MLDCSSLPAVATTPFFIGDVKCYPLPNIYTLTYPNLNRQHPSYIVTNLESPFVRSRMSSHDPENDEEGEEEEEEEEEDDDDDSGLSLTTTVIKITIQKCGIIL